MVIASIDVGLKRIGLALSPNGKLVIPQNAIIRKNRNQAARDVSLFLDEWDVEVLIVGLPIGGSSEDEMGRRIRHFVSLLETQDHLKVYYQDEANSSREAKDQMAGELRHKRDGRIDSIAAQIILERWLLESDLMLSS